MCYARAQRRTVDNFMRPDVHDGPMPLDYNVWILHNAHRTILVDTGFGKTASLARGRPLDFDPIEGLAKLGIQADEVEDIILTHLHYDHAGNIGRFSNARFHVQDSEIAYATGRCMCEAHFRFPFDIEDIVAFVRHTYAERVRFYDGDAAPLPGISLHALPGHSAGMQSVKVMTSRGPVLLASDVSHYFANFLRMAPFVLTLDAEATLRSYEKLKEIGGSVDRIVPGHDPKVRTLLYPKYTFAGIELCALHEPPRPVSEAELASVDGFVEEK
jgi:glyoxylase-like metal-dependent hydrolase (beta-lactamase superfamily II)